MVNGQNAAAIQALFAFLAFILVWRYTAYTRRMMKLAELDRRAKISPLLAMEEMNPHFQSSQSEDLVRVEITVKNVGEGVAGIIWAWHQPVSESFGLSGLLLKDVGPAKTAKVDTGNLMKGESTCARFEYSDTLAPFPHDKKWLFIIDTIDQANGRHQLQILSNTAGKGVTEVSFVNAIGDTLHERMQKRRQRAIETLDALWLKFSKWSR